jgi:hypothetical protein
MLMANGVTFHARGAVEVVLYRLAYADREPAKRRNMFPYGGGMHHFWMNQDPMLGHVAIVDEAGKMDLNAAKPESLQRLFELLTIPEEQRAALMQSIEKRRPTAALSSEDNQVRPGPFVSVEELLQIKGITRSTLYGLISKMARRPSTREGWRISSPSILDPSGLTSIRQKWRLWRPCPEWTWVPRHLSFKHDWRSHLSRMIWRPAPAGTFQVRFCH